MKFALIGCGKIAANHVQAVVDSNMEMIAVCDIISDNMDILLEKSQYENKESVKKYTDYKKMLNENQVDIAAITTASGLHAEMALFCINKGINVIIEKPITMNIAEADEIIALSEQRNVKVAVCHTNRFRPAVQKMRAAVESGRFGKISHGTVHVRWNRGESYYTEAKWRGKWASDGGALMNQCIHGIDLLQWMMNSKIDEVYGVTRRRFHDYIEAEDLGVAIVKFKNGSVATIEGTVNVYPKNLEETLYLFGEKGTAKIGGKSIDSVDVWDFSDEFSDEPAPAYEKGHTGVYADMLDAIKFDRRPYVDAREGKAAVELVLAIYKSQKERKPIKLPLDGFASIDMQGEFDK